MCAGGDDTPVDEAERAGVVRDDAAFVGEPRPMSLVYIFRLRDGRIALLRDYFAPDQVD